MGKGEDRELKICLVTYLVKLNEKVLGKGTKKY